MISFGHDVAKATAALFALILLIAMIDITPRKPLPLAPSRSKPLILNLALLMQASGRSAMLASSTPEQAEMQPECFPSIFQFKSINKQATQTARKPLSLSGKPLRSFKPYPVLILLLSEQATQTAGKPSTTAAISNCSTGITNCSFKLIAHSSFEFKSPLLWQFSLPLFGCSISPFKLLIDDCSSSPSITPQFQTEASVDLPLHSTPATEATTDSVNLPLCSTAATEATTDDPTSPSSPTVTAAGPP
jgi:hypothetical protein